MAGIVTDGLLGYWHYKEGFKGSTWENIAPDTKGNFNAEVNGATLQSDGLKFDGVDDFAVINNFINNNPSLAVEVYYYHNIRGVGGNNSAQGAYPFTIYKDASFRWATQKHSANSYYVFDATTSSNSNGLTGSNKSIVDFQWHQAVFQYNHISNRKELYVNGVLDTSLTPPQRNWQNNFKLYIAATHYNGNTYAFSSAVYACVRVYNRALTSAEVQQNYEVGKEIGLAVAPIETPPMVTKAIANKSKISDEVGINQSIITVQFDKDVLEYVARLNGTDHTTGSNVHQGGVVSANTDAQVIIDWNELSSEGANRINIYGKGSDGQWTPYIPT